MVVCGLDEAGRGALAGPLVGAAVVIRGEIIDKRGEIKDGKLLSARQRGRMYRWLKGAGVQVATEIISARQINNHGIGWANREVFRKLVRKTEADGYIIDGKIKLRVRGKTGRIRSIVDADATIPEVILAGIVAKVERDRIMHQLSKRFPRYHWKTNKGYGAKRHLEALQKYGPCRFHRSVFVTTALRDKS